MAVDLVGKMELRNRNTLPGDLSTDRAVPAPAKQGKRRKLKAPAVVAMAISLLAPVPASAANENPGPPTTTTTVPEPTTTTTTAEPSTTTTIGSSTTTTLPTTTTSGSEATTTTVPGDTTTSYSEGDATTEPEDPLDGEDPEVVEELPLPSIRFPVVGRAFYRDTYGAPRDGGSRLHNGTDIFANKGTPVVAVANGVVERMGETEDAGLFVVVRHSDGWRSVYVHLNNDSPGTDNGLFVHYGPGIRVGARVTAGTVVGYVGDSGNSEESAPHLHFELHQPDRFRPNPYPALRAASRSSKTTMLETVDYRDLVAENAELIGHLDPGTGFNADVTVLDGHAYLGTSGQEGRCPGTGVRVIDVTHPNEPVLVTAFADHTEFPGTSAGSIWVGNVETDHFEGRLGVVGLQDCDNPLTGEDHLVGFATYDLEDPAAPLLLAAHASVGDGVAALDVVSFENQLSVGAVLPVLRPNTNGPSSVVGTFDVTDPASPKTVAVWAPDVKADSNTEESVSSPAVAWVNPMLLHARLTNGGRYEIDLSDPDNPLVETSDLVTAAGGNDQGQAEDQSEVATNGFFIDHRKFPLGTTAELVVGLSSGVRVIDHALPSAPAEVALFVPAPAFDPQHWWTAPDGTSEFPMVWDVATNHGYLYLSDVHSGLWVVEVTVALGIPPGPEDID